MKKVFKRFFLAMAIMAGVIAVPAHAAILVVDVSGLVQAVSVLLLLGVLALFFFALLTRPVFERFINPWVRRVAGISGRS